VETPEIDPTIVNDWIRKCHKEAHEYPGENYPMENVDLLELLRVYQRWQEGTLERSRYAPPVMSPRECPESVP